jgi:tetratricopeptide (TPR) repeat protein
MNIIKTKQNNNLILIIGLILIFSGAFYFKLNKDPEGPPIKIEDDLNIIDKGLLPKDSFKSSSTADTDVNTILSVEKEDRKKFDIALLKGNNSFLVKDYDQAIKYYNQALDYKNSDAIYILLFSVYNVQNNIDQARLSLEKAIKLNPSYTEYWTTKLVFLDEKTGVSFLDLERIYEEGLTKVDHKTKINLITNFARIAENNKEKSEAIALWEYAKTIYPDNMLIYQAEIDRLKLI